MLISLHSVIGAYKLVHYHPRFRVGVASLASYGFIRYVLWNLYKYWSQQKKNANRKSKAQERKQLVKQQCLDGKAEQILALTIDKLINDLKNGTLTAEEVIKAFQKKALELDEQVNGITEPVIEALEQARELDKRNKKDGLLFGMPVSLKECIGIAGYDATGGMGYFVDKILQEDAVVVKVLKKHGAIPFVRTNIPQTMMSFCSSNRIYGETSNPLDLTRSPGGSSSGEGAIIGGGASFIGIGSDIGGSIRIPAAFCGCYGLKTTNRRISYKGVLHVSSGNLAVRSNICPIARDLKSLILLSKALMSEEMYNLDPTLPCLPFSEETVNKTGVMKIGYYVFDGNLHCQPAIVRGVMEAKAALEKRGHTLVPIDIAEMSPPGFDFGQMYVRINAPDRFHNYINVLLAHEKLENSMHMVYLLAKMPPSIMKVIGFLLSFKDKFASDVMLGAIGFKSMREYFPHIQEFQKWSAQFTKSWMDKKLDAVICPVYPSIAPKKGVMELTTAGGVYCMMYNALDYASGALPVTNVTAEDVKNTMDPNHFKPTSRVERLLMKGVEESKGLPVNVQCVSLPFKEEVCLRVMKEVEAGLN